jgi:hypothetical protein
MLRGQRNGENTSSMTPNEGPPMFASIAPSPTFPKRTMNALVLGPIFICLVLPYLLMILAFIFAFIFVRFPFEVLKGRRLRAIHHREVREQGRSVSAETFEEHASRAEGLAIRDMDGSLWWLNQVPEIFRTANTPQRGHRRIVSLLHFDVRETSGEQFERLLDLKDAYLVDIPGRKIRPIDWLGLSHRSQIPMLDFRLRGW